MSSLILSLMSIPPLWLVSRGNRWGWAWGLGMQLPWGIYGCLTGQLGLVVLAAVYTVINLQGLVHYRERDYGKRN